MIDVDQDGYMKDDDDNMYILNNILSIRWAKDDVKYNVALKEFKVFY